MKLKPENQLKSKRIPLTEKRKASMKAYQKSHIEEILIYQAKYKKEKQINDPLFRKEISIRNNFQSYLKFWRNGAKGYGMKSKLNSIIGLTFEDFIIWITNQWEDGMSWDNYGKYEGCWSIDHSIAPSSADSMEELISLFHFKNTKPMWQKDNIIKSNK